MDKKYTRFSAEEFAQDTNFIKWVKKGTDQKEWERFIRENPNLTQDILTARRILSALHFNPKDLQDDAVYTIFKNIDSFHSKRHKIKRTIRFREILQYAAIFILLISLGAAMSIFIVGRKGGVNPQMAILPPNNNEAKLILSGGEEIILKEREPELQFNATGNLIKIDRDSIINYNKKPDQDAMAQVVIPYGKRSTLLMSDGTKVWLNAGSKLIFPQKFSGKNRKVFLQGEAYFDVFKNKGSPFIVSSDNLNVTVHGTQFDVKNNNSDKDIEVVLVEGAVSLKEKGVMNLLSKEIRLIPNQKAVYNKADKTTNVESEVDVAYYISWKEGLLEFNRESIVNVFNRLSKYYNVSFITERSVELNRKISGKLDLKESLEEVMKVISDAAPVMFRIEKNKVFVINKINNLPVR